jgi:glucokinase
MYIVFDIGGSKMRIARSDDGQTISEPIVHTTPEHFKDGISLLVKSIRELAKRKPISSITGGIPGIFDRETGTIIHAPNLRGWEGHSLKEKLLKVCPNVFLENDAALCGLGEATYGSGKGYEVIAYITVSTGVGGARIVDNMIDLRRISFEPGQQIIDHQTLNSLESLISGHALEKRYGKAPAMIEDVSVWKKVGELLAIGLHNSILHWSPDVVVIGGPMILKKPGIDIDYVRDHLKSITISYPTLPELKLAELGDINGLMGALAYAHQVSGDETELMF